MFSKASASAQSPRSNPEQCHAALSPDDDAFPRGIFGKRGSRQRPVGSATGSRPSLLHFVVAGIPDCAHGVASVQPTQRLAIERRARSTRDAKPRFSQVKAQRRSVKHDKDSCGGGRNL